jgi:hypothetical protein
MTDQEAEQVKRIIKEELSGFIKSDRYLFHKLIQILDGQNLQIGRTTGTKIGTNTDQKLGFFGTTPVDKPETVADPTNPGANYNQTVAQSAVDAIDYIIDRLQELGLIK